MEIGDYLRVLRRLWWAVLLAIAVGAGVGYASSLTQTARYESTAELFVTTQSGSSVGDAYQNNLFSQQRAISYAELATSQQVAARAVDQLKAPISAAELRSKISAAAVENTVLLEIRAEDSDPAMAQTYANAVAVQLVQLVSELETSRRGGTPAAGAVIVDDATYPGQASGLSLLSRLGLGAAAGLILGLGLVVVAAFSDSRLRRSDGVAAETDSIVLGALVEEPARSDTEVLDFRRSNVAVERVLEMRNNLLFATNQSGARVKTIAVTSPSRRDRRSTVAIDLAAAFAEANYSVLLVDGDFVNPSLVKRLFTDDGTTRRTPVGGLSTIFAGHHELAQVIMTNPDRYRFALLPAGPTPTQSRHLWASDSAGSVLEHLGQNFDYVVIDTPPLTECSDGALAAALGDGAIVVARLGRTQKKHLRRAMNMLAAAHAAFIGAVVTGEPGHRRKLAKLRTESRPDADQSETPEGAASSRSSTRENRPKADSVRRQAEGKITDSSSAESSQTEIPRSNGTHRVARTKPGNR